MTEAEWDRCEQPSKLGIFFITRYRKAGTMRRQLRQAAVACCRLIPPDLLPPYGGEMLDAVEAWADAGGRRPSRVTRLAGVVHAEVQRLQRVEVRHARENNQLKAAFAIWYTSFTSRSALSHSSLLSCCELAAQAGSCDGRPLPTAAPLMRCVFGNPFRPTAFAPAWRNPTAVALAEAAYATRAFDRLPVLADALEDAGCDAAELLAHFRGPGPHSRGCWALDAVLGKE